MTAEHEIPTIAKHVETLAGVRCSKCGKSGHFRPVRGADKPWVYCGECGFQFPTEQRVFIAAELIQLAIRTERERKEREKRERMKRGEDDGGAIVGSVYRSWLKKQTKKKGNDA